MRTRKRTRIKLHATQPVLEPDSANGQNTPVLAVYTDLEKNLEYFRSIFDRTTDIVFRSFHIPDGRNAAIIYVQGLCDTKQIDSDILLPLTEPNPPAEGSSTRVTLEQVANEYVTIARAQHVKTLAGGVKAIVEQTAVLLLIDEEPTALALSTEGGENRAVEEPSTEAVIRGPREGFNENVMTSMALIRRRLRTPDLKTESVDLGKYTKTKVVICYIDGVVDSNVVEEVRTRIRRIETDGIIDSGYIEEFIEDNPYSPFPQVQNTERPDVVTALLLEGRVGILVNGSPFALLAPINLWGALQAAEDYYERFMIANAIRVLRYVFMFLNLYLPSMYVALTTFHQEMLPNKALLSIAAAREVTPFPALVEALIMEVTFEALREAGVRLPKTIGSAISIVGALVIGQSAVQAGIVSAPMVIVVSLTGIASFVIPRYNFAIALRMLRFPMILCAGTLGIFGIIICTLVIIIHLSSLRSLGVPYLDPVSPYHRSGMKDTFIRVPRWGMQQRPWQTSKTNSRRQTDATRPRNRIPQADEDLSRNHNGR